MERSMAFRRFLTQEDIIRENIAVVVNKLINISSLQELKERGLEGKHFMLIHIMKTMGKDNVETLINKLTSFILKWIIMYEEAESNSITKIIEYFFSTDFTNFHIIFFIGVNRYIYSSHLDSVFISRSRQ